MHVLDRLQEHDGVARLGEPLDQRALEAQVRRARSAAARGRGPRGWRRRRPPTARVAGQHVRAVALAAGHVDDAPADGPRARSTRRRRGGGGTSSSPRGRRAACARRSSASGGTPVGLVALEVEAPAAMARRRLRNAACTLARRMAAPAHRRGRSATSTRATTTAPPPATTRSGASTSARPAASRCSASCARRSAREPRALRARAGDRRRHRLLLAEPAARRRRERGDVHRHLAGHARRAERQRARAWASTSRRAPRRRGAAVRGRARSTSCSATPCCTTCPTSTAPSPSSTACCGPGGARRLRRRAVALRRPHRRRSPSARPTGRRPLWRRADARRPGAQRPRRRRRREPRASSALVDVHAFTPEDLARRRAGARASTDVRVRGEELLANWFGWANRALEATADPDEVPVRVEALRLPRLPRAAGGRPPRCSSRACRAAIFYNLMIAARRPA